MSALSFPDTANLCALPGCTYPATRGLYCSSRCYEAGRVTRACRCGNHYNAHPHDPATLCGKCRKKRKRELAIARKGVLV